MRLTWTCFKWDFMLLEGLQVDQSRRGYWHLTRPGLRKQQRHLCLKLWRDPCAVSCPRYSNLRLLCSAHQRGSRPMWIGRHGRSARIGTRTLVLDIQATDRPRLHTRLSQIMWSGMRYEHKKSMIEPPSLYNFFSCPFTIATCNQWRRNHGKFSFSYCSRSYYTLCTTKTTCYRGFPQWRVIEAQIAECRRGSVHLTKNESGEADEG